MFREFKEGRTDVHDEERSGQPSVFDETIAKVAETILKDRKVTIRKLSDIMSDVSKTSVDKISKDNLGYAKVCASGKLKKEIVKYLRGSGIKKIVHHMEKCIVLNGDRVEK